MRKCMLFVGFFLIVLTELFYTVCIVLYGAGICDNNIQQIDEIFSSPESSSFFLLPLF